MTSAKDKGFVFATGPGQIEKQSLYLLRSIKENTSAKKSEIFVFIAEEEKEEISKECIDEIKRKATVLEGRIPNKDYLLSSAHKALLKAREKYRGPLVLLDTDTVVIRDFEVCRDQDLMLKPVDLGNQYWGREKSRDEWAKLYEKYGIDMPEKELESTVDKKKILPYFNAGVIISNNKEFPQEWLEISKEIFGNLEKDNYFSDQVSLALLAEKYDTKVVNEDYNFPIHLRFNISDQTRIIHYHDTNNLILPSLRNNELSKKLEGTGIIDTTNSHKKHKLYVIILKTTLKKTKNRIKNRLGLKDKGYYYRKIFQNNFT